MDLLTCGVTVADGVSGFVFDFVSTLSEGVLELGEATVCSSGWEILALVGAGDELPFFGVRILVVKPGGGDVCLGGSTGVETTELDTGTTGFGEATGSLTGNVLLGSGGLTYAGGGGGRNVGFKLVVLGTLETSLELDVGMVFEVALLGCKGADICEFDLDNELVGDVIPEFETDGG